MGEVEHVLAVANPLGEGPLWHAEEGVLYWVEMEDRKVFRFDPATGHYESFAVEPAITALAARTSGGFLAAVTTGFAFWDIATQELILVGNPEAEIPTNRFNDGAVDCQGRFWAGTLNMVQFDAPHGSLYCLSPDQSIRRMETGIAECNGIGWSPDNTTLYLTETMRRLIWAYDFDPSTGVISNRRPFAEISQANVYPDGLAVDSEGFVWSAQWGGWNVTRYDPSGKIERVIRLPVQQVTNCAFGGPNLDDLYITTARTGLSQEEMTKQPWAGALFRARLGIKGIPEPKFAG
jgi:sugar lactone lactonase YvrE